MLIIIIILMQETELHISVPQVLQVFGLKRIQENQFLLLSEKKKPLQHQALESK